MIQFTQGNLLDASAEALVNTVNEVGVMGKGIALMFRERFPANTHAYTEASKAKAIRVGHMFVAPTGELFPKWIINFPTKKHWRNPSRIDWIRDGLDDLVRVVGDLGVTSVALPPLGCGNGGLDWPDVRPLIEAAASQLPHVDFLVYEPTDAYFNAPKQSGVEKLTVARALVAELVRRYSVLDLDCTILEVQKLSYFLQRTIVRMNGVDPLDLRFAADKYGPYADRLRHLLNGLDGSYLRAEKRLSDAGPRDLIWFDASRRAAVNAFLMTPEAAPYAPALAATTSLIDGFESPLGMELLATIDWLTVAGRAEASVESVRAAIAHWPVSASAAQRKLSLFDDRLISLALDRLVQHHYIPAAGA
jgi:O-acetyl-ADP-ribose deacetylase (regulator of RNase III)